jgi:hypothetical protein
MKKVMVLGCLGLFGMACASAQVDLRGNAAVSGQGSRLIVSGPMKLLHANYDRRAGVVFSRATQRAESAPDCSTGAPVGWDGESDLTVGQGEAICVSATRLVNLSWHARSLTEVAEEGVRHASNR